MSDQYTAYVGTQTEANGLYHCRVDVDTGRVQRIGAADAGETPSFFALHPSGDYLYAGNMVDAGTVTTLEIGDDGELSRVGQAESGGHGPCHVSVDASGAYLFAADYHEGHVSMLPIGANGAAREPSHVIERKGSSVDPGRQQSPHPHSITPGPENEVAYLADLGTDELVVYGLDFDAGRLEPEQSVDVEGGAGPRHVDVHPNGSTLYLLCEMDSTLRTFERDSDGHLTEVASTGTLPAGYGGDNATAEVLVHPSGAYLYASNRGHDSIAIFELDGDGMPSLIGHEPTGGEWPRNFALGPDGRFLFAENQHTDDVRTFRIDEATGDLEPTGDVVEIPQPSCMKFRT